MFVLRGCVACFLRICDFDPLLPGISKTSTSAIMEGKDRVPKVWVSLEIANAAIAMVAFSECNLCFLV